MVVSASPLDLATLRKVWAFSQLEGQAPGTFPREPLPPEAQLIPPLNTVVGRSR